MSQPHCVASNYLPKGIELLGASCLWPVSQGEGTVIAVLDTGIDIHHPELAPNLIGGRNFTSDYGGDPDQYQDNHSHGTHVASTIAAAGNKSDVIGVAPQAKLFAGKILNGQQRGTQEWLEEGIRYCTRWRGPNGERIHVINLSGGVPIYNASAHEAIQQAVKQGITVIAATGDIADGNPDTEELLYPAALPEVISVGALDCERRTLNFSAANREVDVAAPGESVLSSWPGCTYASVRDTSMAAPHVSGFAALLRGVFFNQFGHYPNEVELYYLIKFCTIDMAEVGLNASSGAGVLSVLPFFK